MMPMFRNILTVISLFGWLLLPSCTPQKKLIYFQGQVPSLAESAAYQVRIYPGDILSINIFTINTEAYPYLSVPADKPMSDTRSAYEKGIIVNEAGEVKLPLVGAVSLNGKTITEEIGRAHV